MLRPSVRRLTATAAQSQFTHLSPVTGRPRMVDVSDKQATTRTAVAVGRVRIQPATVDALAQQHHNQRRANLASIHTAPESSSSSSSLLKTPLPAVPLRKGDDVFMVAQLAGVMASKRCADLIPLCHPLPLTHSDVQLRLNQAESCVDIRATCRCHGPTGVEMEALTACSVAALTVYDMLKAVDKHMTIDGVRLVSKTGGRSGDFNLDKTE